MARLDLSPEELRNLFETLTKSTPTEEDEGFLTITEMMEKISASRQYILTVLNACKAEGLLEVRRVLRPNLAGTLSSKPGYRLKDPPKPEKKRGNKNPV